MPSPDDPQPPGPPGHASQQPTADPDRMSATGGGYAIPSRVGHYQIKRVIGAGSFGTVYEAIQDQPHRPVALKLLRPTTDDTERYRRFRVEAEVLGRLRHPGIAQVFEAGVHRGEGLPPGMVLPFIAMELIAGARPLTEFCQHTAPDRAARVRLLIQCCHAIEHAHALHVIHRDLKPTNILVEPGEQDPIVKVIDFGVSRWDDADAMMLTSGTAPDQLVGTVAYMSPEQCSGGHVGPASDQYALGVILFQLLTGALPHDTIGQSIAVATGAIRDKPPMRPTKLVPDLGADLEIILLKTLEKEASRRYPDVGAFREDLQRWLDGQPIVARSASAAYVARRQLSLAVRAQRGLFGVVLLVVSFVAAQIFTDYALQAGQPLQRSYAHALAAVAPPGTDAIARLNDVAVIGFSDTTDMPAAAARLGITGVSPAVPKSFRSLHGALMKHLVNSGVRVVVFDIAFAAPSNGMEPAFVEGVRALQDSGVDVVVVMPTWHIGAGGEILLDPAIAASGVRFGITSGSFNSTDIWSADAYMRRPGRDPVPGLTVAAYAAFKAPRVEPHYTALSDSLEIGYEQKKSASYWLAGASRPPDQVPLSGVSLHQKPNADLGIEADDQNGQYAAWIPRQAGLVPGVIDYAAALSLSAPELRAKVGGKAVIIANLRSDSGDVKARPNSSETIAGPLVVAALLQNLISKVVYTVPNWYAQNLLLVLPAALMLLAGWRLGSRGTLVLATLLLTAALPLVSILLYRLSTQVWNPEPAALALWITAAGVIMARRDQARQRSSQGTLA